MTTSAFGKVILIGEHAVVYGHPAIAGALELGVDCTASASATRELEVPAWSLSVEEGDEGPVSAALDIIYRELGVSEPLSFVVETALPPAAGLGSSAALTVAVTRAAAAATARAVTDDEVERIANAAECAFHDTPSGVDVALACHGGIGLFRRGEGLSPLAAEPLTVAIGLSGEPRRTRDMVNRVAEQVREISTAKDRLTRLGSAAADAARALEAGDLDTLAELMTAAQADLAGLNLSTDRLDQLIAIAREAGALAAKLTGAGGGGAVVALAPTKSEEIVAAWKEAGFSGFSSRVGVTRDH